MPRGRDDLERACAQAELLPLGPQSGDRPRLVSILDPFGQYVGMGDLGIDRRGCIALRVVSLVATTHPEQSAATSSPRLAERTVI